MKNYQIICPYCFKIFSHADVHFRMETVFDENSLNDDGLTENEVAKLPDSPRKELLMTQTTARKHFLSKDDAEYQKFWGKFEGGTSELSLGHDEKLPCKVHQLPIVNPGTAIGRSALKRQQGDGTHSEEYFIYDGDGLVSMVEDRFGVKTNRRVCPKCHNPLPRQYGKNPVKFISVIGVTGAGKTVYISQLLKHMSDYLASVNMSTYFTSDHEPNFIRANPVEMGQALPDSTMKGTFSQPMFYDLVTRKGQRLITNTIVIYDIAGEDCQNAADMAKYGDYINQADGLMLLVDPTQLKWVTGSLEASAEPSLVLNTIHTATTNAVNQLCEIPIAVCVSKSDSFEDMITQGQNDIYPVTDDMGRTVPVFNASDYNELEVQLVQRMNPTLANNLRTSYKYYNFFAFSAIGGPVEQKNTADGERSYPIAPPVPRRIAEPLLWLLHRFGYISSDRPIRLPEPREMPEYIEVPAAGLFSSFKKPTRRELTAEEKEKYWYEESC